MVYIYPWIRLKSCRARHYQDCLHIRNHMLDIFDASLPAFVCFVYEMGMSSQSLQLREQPSHISLRSRKLCAHNVWLTLSLYYSEIN